MTDASREGLEHHPAQQEDVLPWRALAGVLVATIALSFGLGGWACSVARRLGPPIEGPRPDAVDPIDLLRSNLDHELFDSAPIDAERGRNADRRRLEEWGWVDRERGIVHMPIEAAMRIHLSGSPSAQETAAR